MARINGMRNYVRVCDIGMLVAYVMAQLKASRRQHHEKGFWVFSLIFLIIAIRIRKYLIAKKIENLEKFLIIGLIGSIVGFLTNAIFIDVFEASKVAITFWLLVGLLMGIIRIETKSSLVKK